MIAILVSWICIFIVFFTFGDFLIFIYKKNTIQSENYCTADIFILGMCATSLMLSALSLFLATGHFILISFLLICIAYWIFRRAQLKSYIRSLKEFIGNNGKAALFSFVFLGIGFLLFPVWSFSVKLDPFIYHYSNILWNESYPVVPGLANLDEKYGFNSNYFLLSSCFSLRFLFGQLIVGIQSILAFFIAGSFLYEIIKSKFDIRPVFAFALYFVMIYFNQNELSETSTDIIPNLIIYYLFARIILNPDSLKRDFLFYAIVPVTIITFKLSAAPVLLICLIPLITLLKAGNRKTILILFFFSFAVILFWTIRNVIISGYVVLPLYQLDLFSFDWKTPVEVVKAQKEFIHSYSVNKTLTILRNIDVNNYFFYSTTLVILFCAVSVILVIFNFILKSKSSEKNNIYRFTFAVLFINLIFWVISAPDVRFAYGYIFAVIFFAFYSFLSDNNWDEREIAKIKNHRNTVGYFLLGISIIWGIYGCKWALKYTQFLTANYVYTASAAYKEALIRPIRLEYLIDRELKREDERFNDAREFKFTKYPLNDNIELYISSSRLGFVFEKIPAAADCSLDKSTFHDYRKVEARSNKIEDGFRYGSRQ